jgi:peroxiredoxin
MDGSWGMSGRSIPFAIYRITQFLLDAALFFAAGIVFLCGSDCGLAVGDDQPTDQTTAPVATVKPSTEKVAASQDRDATPQRSAAETKQLEWYGYLKHEHAVTMSGRVLNEDGEPVNGARVIVVPVIPNGVAYDKRVLIVEGITDAAGQYRFEDVKLSVLEFKATAVPKPSEALFQVFAVAEGYGYAWRHTQAYRPEKRPADVIASPKVDDDEGDDVAKKLRVLFLDEPIELDLKLSPEVRVHGTIRDDLGNLLKGADVQLGYVTHSRGLRGNGRFSSNGVYLKESARGTDGPFEGFFALPEELRMARTDADGRYEIRGIPRDCVLYAVIDYLPEYDPWRGSILTSEVRQTSKQSPDAFVGYAGELNREFVAPVTVRVTVLGATRQPLENVVVRIDGAQRVRRSGTLARTDASGIATLKLRPGKTMIIAEPAIGVGYLPANQSIELKTDPRDYAIELELKPAAEVQFEAIEKETGKPVPGVAFLSEPSDARERQSVQSQVSFVDHPRTDTTGRMQAFFVPGSRRFFVDQQHSAREFEAVSPTTDEIELAAGNPVTVRFEFTRRPIVGTPVTSSEPVADELKPLEELLLKQAERFEQSRRLRIQLGNTNHVETTMTREQITELLESFSSKSHEECLDALHRTFGIAAGTRETLITDGVRRRVDSRYLPEAALHVNVFNGEDMIITMNNEQLDIYSRANAMIHFLDLRDFWEGPAHVRVLAMPKQAIGKEPSKRTIHHSDGNWVIDIVSGNSSVRRIIDDSTGFERLVSISMPERKYARDTWQFFPILLPTKLSIAIEYQDNKPRFRNVVTIASVELLDKIPADAFVVGAPAGTNIIDYRGMSRDRQFDRRPPSSVISADTPDVVAYRNRIAPAAEPVLKPGDKAPDLNVVTWLDSAGKTERPDLAGKIVVIDFWGISCGPCVAALHEVNAAAKHFADSQIIVIGLHDSSGKLDSVSEFAKKRGLIFPIAIDNPDPAQRSFGATCSAFGVDGIPSCVVIDGNGHVAYIGQFDRAIEAANQLVIKK